MKSAGIIPSRYASTRFPGKPLVMIGHKSMLQRVYEKARLSNLDEVIIATDDDRIKTHAEDLGARVVMTSPDIQNGTIRCETALKKLGLSGMDVVINIQGDEPFIQPGQINSLLTAFDDPSVEIATLAHHFESREELELPTTMKIVLDKNRDALYFSRSVIPFVRDSEKMNWLDNFNFLKHIGIYAFKPEVLSKLIDLPVTTIEQAESLEQLRWLYNGYKIRIIETQYHGISIDTPEDIEKANYLLNILYE